MAVLNVRAYTFFVRIPPKSSVNSKGDYVENPNTGGETEEYKCDIVPSGSANTIRTNDGERVSYSYTIYADKAPSIEIGQTVCILDSSKSLIFEGPCKGIARYQFQVKIWV